MMYFCLVSAKPLSKKNAWIFLIGPLGTDFGEILFAIDIRSRKSIRKYCRENGNDFVSAFMYINMVNHSTMMSKCSNYKCRPQLQSAGDTFVAKLCYVYFEPLETLILRETIIAILIIAYLNGMKKQN